MQLNVKVTAFATYHVCNFIVFMILGKHPKSLWVYFMENSMAS
jgi:hypothetical protein